MEPTGIAGNRNARVAHIRKFVCVPPERGHVLRLVACEEPPTVLGEWLRDGCIDNGSTAEEVDSRLREHATAQQQELIANLVWQAENGLVVVTKRLRCKPELDPANMDPAHLAQTEALGINGTLQGGYLQAQRGLEAAMRSYFSAHQTQIGQANALIGILGNLVNESQVNAHRAHLELDKLRSQQRRELDLAWSQLRDAEDAAQGDGAESAARSDLYKQIGGALSTALPYIVQHVARVLTESPANDTASQPTQSSSAAAE